MTSTQYFSKTLFIKRISLVMFWLIITVSIFAQFAGGSGTEDDPWQVATPEHLDMMRLTDYIEDNFIQIADIDLGIPPYNQDEGWLPITSFLGNYDGSDYVIRGLTINRPETNYVGLFATTINAQIRRVGLKDVNVSGNEYVGGLIGKVLESTAVELCFMTGSLSGTNYFGGIVGFLSDSSSRVTNNYSTALLYNTCPSGSAYVGGIVGYRQHGTIRRNYVVGPIYYDFESPNIGVVVGGHRSASGEVTTNYWNIETTGVSRDGTGIGTGFTTREMMQRRSYLNYSFNMFWRIDEGLSFPYFQWEGEQAGSHNLPFLLPPTGLSAEVRNMAVSLSWQAPNEEMGVPDGYHVYRSTGIGSSIERINEEMITDILYQDSDFRDYFVIYSYQVSAVYSDQESILSQKVGIFTYSFAGGDGSEEEPYLVENANQLYSVRFHPEAYYRQTAHIDADINYWNGGGWQSIPVFRGVYDGSGFEILNLPKSLFFRMDTAELKRVGLKDVDMMSSGVFSDEMHSSAISNCYATGFFSLDRDRSGGFVNYSRNSVISNSYSYLQDRNVENRYLLGGLTGFCRDTSIINCYVIGTLSESTDPFIGYEYGNSTVINSYWDTETTGITHSTWGEGLNAIDMTRQENFENWDFDDVWAIGGNGNETYPYLRVFGEPSEHNYPCVPPGIHTYTDGDSRIIVTWSLPSIGEPDNYRIFRDNHHLTTIDAGSENYLDETVENFTTYTYHIFAEYGNRVSSRSAKSATTPVAGGYSGGRGCEIYPYQIRFPEQLHNIRFNISSHYLQTEDIDLSDYGQWQPIGTIYGEHFSGTYNGSGFVIKNLKVKLPYSSEIFGIFGTVRNASIQNVGVIDVDIDSYARSGSLIGRAINSTVRNCYSIGKINGAHLVGGLIAESWESTIENCFSTGTVIKRTSGTVGGLVGYVSYSTIRNSYSTNIVSGNRDVGGLIGNAFKSQLENCYSAGHVSGHRNYETTTGGLIGNAFRTSTFFCYWDVETSRQRTSDGGEGKTTTEMLNQTDYLGWDFESIWTIIDDFSYPALRWQEENYYTLPGPTSLSGMPENEAISLHWLRPYNNPIRYNIYRDDDLVSSVQDVTENNYRDVDRTNWHRYTYKVTALFELNGELIESLPTNMLTISPVSFASGNGTEQNPFVVANATHLNGIRFVPSSHFILQNDVKLSESPWIDDGGWIPIGNDLTSEFNGNFDGGGHTITGLTINRPQENLIGLFGMATNATIKNVVLSDVNIISRGYAGTLIGLLSWGKIENCSATGNIVSTGYMSGGLVGGTFNSTVNMSYANVNISGSQAVGGLIGSIRQDSYISDSYSRGSVYVQRDRGGGLIGDNDQSHIINCFSASSINRADNSGGLVGINSNGTCVNSYWDSEKSGMTQSAQGEGRRTVQMTFPYSENTYQLWDFNNIWQEDTDSDINSGYPYLRLSNYMSAEEDNLQPQIQRISLSNFPNPFNPETTISFSIMNAGDVVIDIFNIKGRHVTKLVDEHYLAGHHRVVWNGYDKNNQPVGSGVYMYRLEIDNKSKNRKMMLLK